MSIYCACSACWLLVGVDALLTTLFRGGGFYFYLQGKDAPIGPTPKTDAELGLVVKGDDVLLSRLLAAQVQVIKGDTQKADSVAVPDHLWVYAFLCGYGWMATGQGTYGLWACPLRPLSGVC